MKGNLAYLKKMLSLLRVITCNVGFPRPRTNQWEEPLNQLRLIIYHSAHGAPRGQFIYCSYAGYNQMRKIFCLYQPSSFPGKSLECGRKLLKFRNIYKLFQLLRTLKTCYAMPLMMLPCIRSWLQHDLGRRLSTFRTLPCQEDEIPLDPIFQIDFEKEKKIAKGKLFPWLGRWSFLYSSLSVHLRFTRRRMSKC